MLQRLTEDLEYSDLLDRASRCESSLEQMCLVAAFSVSSYSTTIHRTAKPFNPLLGETYELDRLDDFGYRSICEQVRHNTHTGTPRHALSLKHVCLRCTETNRMAHALLMTSPSSSCSLRSVTTPQPPPTM